MNVIWDITGRDISGKKISRGPYSSFRLGHFTPNEKDLTTQISLRYFPILKSSSKTSVYIFPQNVMEDVLHCFSIRLVDRRFAASAFLAIV